MYLYVGANHFWLQDSTDFHYSNLTNVYMKPYHTSFLRVVACIALLCSLSFVSAERANANCSYFTLGTQDTTWSFTAAVGQTQSRTLIVTNNSDSTLILDAVVYNSSLFHLNDSQFTIYGHDTVSVVITFAPLQGPGTSVNASIRFAKHGTDCRQYFNLYGTITGSTGGGHDKVVTLSPSPEDFPAVAAGKDTCLPFYLVNYTGGQVKIESITFLHGNPDFKIDPAFNGATMDSGGYYRFMVCSIGDANHTEFSDSLVVKYSDGNGLHTINDLLVGHTAANTTGGGTGDILVADPHAFSFGTVGVDSSVCRSVIVTNKSTSISTVLTGWHICDGSSFKLSPAFSGADTLAPGASKTFEICYQPLQSDSGAKTCSLTVNYLRTDSSSDTKSVLVSFYGVKAGSNTGGSPACIRTEQGSNYHDAVVVGGSAQHTLYLINAGTTSITLNTFDIYGPDASSFSIDSKQFPITVPANSSTTTLLYTFSPTSSSKTEFNARAAFSLSGDRPQNCDSAYAYLIGYAVHSVNTVDTVVRPLFPNESRTLGLEGNGSTVSTTFYFTNNYISDCTVNKIWLTDTKYFSITSTNPSPTPFVLHPGDNLTVVVAYSATDNHVHYDSLMIDANHNLQAQSFQLQAVQITAGVPNALPSGVAINVSPNPASAYVSVDMAGVKSADVQIIDLLGNIVTTAKSSSSWRWNASNAVSGSYIVRISGQSIDGEQFVASKRIIVSK
jgi:hypothetical protein